MGADDETRRITVPAGQAKSRSPHLIVLEGEGLGQVFRLARPETVIGRSPEVHICLESDLISRRHARVTVAADQITVEDLGSRNGTYVDLDLVREPRLLHDGARLGIASSTLLLTHSVAPDAAMQRAAFERASRDPGTVVANTHYFIDRLHGEQAFAIRHREPLTLVFLRVDGMPAGPGDDGMERPEVASKMREVAATLRASLRAEDLLARASEDCFVALLRSSGRQAVEMAERVRPRGTQPAGPKGAGIVQVTLTAVVMPLALSGLAADDVLGTAMQLATSVLRGASNRVVLLPPGAIESIVADGG